MATSIEEEEAAAAAASGNISAHAPLSLTAVTVVVASLLELDSAVMDCSIGDSGSSFARLPRNVLGVELPSPTPRRVRIDEISPPPLCTFRSGSV